MGSHSQDSSTQKTASAGATANDTQLAQNAAQNQTFANNTRSSLFGTQGPNGQYTGGTVSNFLNPSSVNQSGLTGSYLDNYNNAADAASNDAKNAVGTTMTNLAQRGMGKTPAGFAADQERKAFADASTARGNLFAGATNQQHSDALNNYWNATNMLNSNATNTANLSVQGNQAAAGNYASLYGTASQQVPSAVTTGLGLLQGAGAKGVTL